MRIVHGNIGRIYVALNILHPLNQRVECGRIHGGWKGAGAVAIAAALRARNSWKCACRNDGPLWDAIGHGKAMRRKAARDHIGRNRPARADLNGLFRTVHRPDIKAHIDRSEQEDQQHRHHESELASTNGAFIALEGEEGALDTHIPFTTDWADARTKATSLPVTSWENSEE